LFTTAVWVSQGPQRALEEYAGTSVQLLCYAGFEITKRKKEKLPSHWQPL